MSDTPRTDALRIPSEALLLLGQKGVPEKVVQAILALGEHARQLERENAVLRAQNEAMHDDLHEHDERRHWAEAKVAELREALERIAARGIYSVNGGHACATCRAFWHPDPVVINFQSEHHYDRCAYVIAREALKPHAQGGSE